MIIFKDCMFQKGKELGLYQKLDNNIQHDNSSNQFFHFQFNKIP